MSRYFAYTGGETPPVYLGLGQPVALLLVSFRRGNRRLSHVPVKPALHLPCSQTPDESLHLPCRALDAVPAEATTKTPSLQKLRGSITRLLKLLSTLRADISADYARLASVRWLIFNGQDWLPVGFLRKVSMNSFIPLSRAAHGAMLLFSFFVNNLRIC